MRQGILRLLWNLFIIEFSKFHIRTTSLFHVNTVITLTSYFFNISLSITFPSKSSSLKWWLTFRSDPNFVCISNFYMHATHLACSSSFTVIAGVWWAVQIMEMVTWHLLQPRFISSHEQIFFPIFCFQTPSICARFGVLMAITMKNVLFWVVRQRSPERPRRFGEMEAIFSSETSSSIRTTRSCNKKAILFNTLLRRRDHDVDNEEWFSVSS